MRSERREVVGVVIHIVSVAGLAGASVTSPVMGDDAIAVIQEEHHLGVPVVARKRPTVRENDRLAAAPILVVNRSAVFHGDRAHVFFSSRSGYEFSDMKSVFRHSPRPGWEKTPSRRAA